MRNISYALASLLTIGCASSAGGNAPPPASDKEYDDTAQAIGSSTAQTGGGDLAAMGDVMLISRGILPFGLSTDADGHVRGERFGISFDYALACFTENDVRMQTCAETTDRVDASVEVGGELDLAGNHLSLSRTGNWSIDGMQSTVATLNGHGTFDVDATVNKVPYAIHYTANYDAVAVNTGVMQTTGGTATFDIDATRDDTEFSIHAVLAFHADHTATMTLDGTRVYVIDLANGAVTFIGGV